MNKHFSKIKTHEYLLISHNKGMSAFNDKQYTIRIVLIIDIEVAFEVVTTIKSESAEY